jgi:hypothetical protein
MKHHKDEYVIVSGKEAKPYLAQVHDNNENKKTLTVIPDKFRYRGINAVEMPYSGVLVNLGKDPAPGKVYGVDVTNRYRKTIHSDVWGPIHFFVKPDKTSWANSRQRSGPRKVSMLGCMFMTVMESPRCGMHRRPAVIKQQ